MIFSAEIVLINQAITEEKIGKGQEKIYTCTKIYEKRLTLLKHKERKINIAKWMPFSSVKLAKYLLMNETEIHIPSVSENLQKLC